MRLLDPISWLTIAALACARGEARSGSESTSEEAPARRAAESSADAPPSPPFAVRSPPHRPDSVHGVALPEPPRWTIDSRESSTPSAGRRVRAASSDALRAALRDARGGDVILLVPGGEYVGNFALAPIASAADGAWITIRTDGTLPPEGTRITPSLSGQLARLLTPNGEPALRAAASAHHYRLSGLEVGAARGVGTVNTLIAFGDAGEQQRRIASVPHHLVVDRMLVRGTATLNLRRCLALNSAWTAVVDSWLAECHSNDGDSQAIWGANGPGPFTVVNNYLEGAGENVMFGGSDSRAPELLPADITLRRNHFNKPASWIGVWTVKNLFELKVGRRVLLEGNLLEGAWVSGQIGFAILLKSSDQDNTAPWSTTQDVTMRLNRISRSAAGIQVSGTIEGDRVTESTARVLVEQNLIDPVGDPALGGVGRLFAVGSATAPRDVVFRHNTGFGTNAALIFYEGETKGFAFLDNVANGGEYRWSISSSVGKGVGSAALANHAPGGVAEGNLFLGADAAPRPERNFYVDRVGDAGFSGIAGLALPKPGSAPPPEAYALRAASPFHGRGTDGTDPGVAIPRLLAALRGVAAAPPSSAATTRP